jgi:hypothetical protein
MRKLLSLATPLLLLLSLTGCEFDEGINVHDMEGTVLVPKSIAPTADDVGMIYVGLYSGVDMHLGYPSPIAAPAASTAGADTFPYGGTSLGTFMSRDVRTVCQIVGSRSIRDDGANWALDFDVLQFPFYEGTNVWAWMDTLFVNTAGNVTNTYTSCDPDNGYYSYYQIEVVPTNVQAVGTQWEIQLEDSELPVDPQGDDAVPGGAGDRRYQDADGKIWQLVDVDPATDTILVFDIYSWGGKPAATGPSQPIIFSMADLQYFGSQYQDVLNFPAKYLRGANGTTPGDFVSETPVVLENLSGNVEITIDFEVP